MRRTAVINVVGLTESLLGPSTPRLNAFIARGKLARITPVIPAVTCTAQSTYVTGRMPGGHGAVANGWYNRELAEVQFWKQSNHLVQGRKIWDELRELDPGFTCAKLFWWYNMYSTADWSITPRPAYPADGRKVFDIYTGPMSLRQEIKKDLGEFPFPTFWGPAAGIKTPQGGPDAASRWIAESAKWIENKHCPTLSLIYLPHLDYALQKVGPGHPSIRQELREIDRIVGGLFDVCSRLGVKPLIVSEYGIVPVRDAVWINRILRDAGYLAVRLEGGRGHQREILDLEHSRAFAVSDHQVAHVTVRDPADVATVEALLSRVDGIERTLSGEARRAVGLDHPRAGDIVCVSAADRWFAYGWWLDDAKAPDYARTVDIHRKPGYDPCELFLDPKLLWPKGRVMGKLLLRKLGLRALLDVIPLDASLVRGSHGRAQQASGFDPVLIGDLPDPFLEQSMPMACVRDAILACTLGAEHATSVQREFTPATRVLLSSGRR